MPGGRPRTRANDERTTSVALDREAEKAIMRIQFHRFEQTGHKPTLRDLITCGIELLLKDAGLEPMAEPARIAPPVVTISKKIMAKSR
jgi:hypothetical protein